MYGFSSADCCKPEPRTGRNMGADLKVVCSAKDRQRLRAGDDLGILMLDFEVLGSWGLAQSQRQGAEFPAPLNKIHLGYSLLPASSLAQYSHDKRLEC